MLEEYGGNLSEQDRGKMSESEQLEYVISKMVEELEHDGMGEAIKPIMDLALDDGATSEEL